MRISIPLMFNQITWPFHQKRRIKVLEAAPWHTASSKVWPQWCFLSAICLEFIDTIKNVARLLPTICAPATKQAAEMDLHQRS